MDNSVTSLTRHRAGSLRELWALAWPMMLASFSSSLMVCVDRIVLSHYSTDAFIACTTTQPWYWTVSFSLMCLVNVTEVLVGRLNGSGDYKKIGPLIWQMISLGVMCFVFLAPVIYYVPYLLADNVKMLGIPYLRILIFFYPFELIGFGAIGSFFVGRGETKWVPFVLICENLLNIFLDIWFVFGGIGLKPMGIHGAAYATGLSQLLGCAIFLTLFLRKRYRERFGVRHFSFSIPLLRQCLKLGIPNSFNAFINVAGWAFAYQILAVKISKAHLVAYGIAHSFYVFFWFIIEGIGKGVGASASNFLGAKKFSHIDNVLWNAVKLGSFFVILTFLLMILIPLPVVRCFVDESFMKDGDFILQTRKLLFWSWLVFFFETLWMVGQSFWLAVGRARFTMTINVLCFWLIALLPMYLLIGRLGLNSVVFLQLIFLDLITRTAIFYRRYRLLEWRN